MTAYTELQDTLVAEPKIWLVTGVAGVIGITLLEALLKLNQRVAGLDKFSTCYRQNFDEVQSLITAEKWVNFRFIEGEIRSLADCQQACLGVDYVCYHAA